MYCVLGKLKMHCEKYVVCDEKEEIYEHMIIGKFIGKLKKVFSRKKKDQTKKNLDNGRPIDCFVIDNRLVGFNLHIDDESFKLPNPS